MGTSKTILNGAEPDVRRPRRRQGRWVVLIGLAAILAVDVALRLWPTPQVPQLHLRATLQGHDGSSHSMDFSPDGGLLATGNWEGTASLWDMGTETVRATVSHPGGLEGGCAHSGDDVRPVAFSPDGATIATCGPFADVRLWDVASAELHTTLPHEEDSVLSLTFSPDGSLLVTGGMDYMWLWDVKSEEAEVPIDRLPGFYSVAFSPDGKVIAASGSPYRKVDFFDATTLQVLRTFQKGGDFAYSPVFSPDGKLLATVGAEGVTIWSVESGKELVTLTRKPSTTYWSPVFSPNGAMLVTVSNYNAKAWWDVIPVVGRFDWRPDSGYYNGVVDLWDTGTWSRDATWEHPEGAIGNSLAVSPDGKTIAASFGDETVRLFDMPER